MSRVRQLQPSEPDPSASGIFNCTIYHLFYPSQATNGIGFIYIYIYISLPIEFDS